MCKYLFSHESLRSLKALAFCLKILDDFTRGKKNVFSDFPCGMQVSFRCSRGQSLILLFHLQFCNNRYSGRNSLNNAYQYKLRRHKKINPSVRTICVRNVSLRERICKSAKIYMYKPSFSSCSSLTLSFSLPKMSQYNYIIYHIYQTHM